MFIDRAREQDRIPMLDTYPYYQSSGRHQDVIRTEAGQRQSLIGRAYRNQ